MINILFVVFSTYLLWEFFGKDNISTVIKAGHTTISTTFIVLFGEFIPKMYASNNNLKFSKNVSFGINIAVKILKPISIPLIKLGGIFRSGFSREKYILSSEQLNRALELTNSGESFEQDEILKGIVTLGLLSVKQVMIRRTDITAVDIDSNFHELMDIINKSGYSRLPVYQYTIDNIKGTIYSRDLLLYIDKGEDFDWSKLLRKSLFIPETKKLDSLFLEFKEQRVHMAIVVDEYGGTSGLITMEDVISKIIGNIANDSSKAEIILHKQLDKSTFIFPGKIYLTEFCRHLKIEVSTFKDIKGESESLAGLLLELNGELPNVGAVINYKQFHFTIMAVDSRRIKRVKVKVNPK